MDLGETVREIEIVPQEEPVPVPERETEEVEA